MLKTFTPKEQGVFSGLQENRPPNIGFKGGLFLNRYNRKGQVKFSSYIQYGSVFVNSAKPLFVRVTEF